VTALALGQRKPVLPQIDLPHPLLLRELYLPQMTSGPARRRGRPTGSGWSTPCRASSGGSAWMVRSRSSSPTRRTDHQPDWSPDGGRIALVRYDGRAMELMLLDLAPAP